MKKKKLQAIAVISVLLLLIYGKNLTERQAFKSISKTFTDVYNDRLVVEGYIFQISDRLFSIQKLIDHCNMDYDYSRVINEIDGHEKGIMDLIVDFEKTNLTIEESDYLTDFKKIIENDLSIKNYDLLYSDSSGVNTQQVKLYDQKIALAKKDLENLSKIQMDEGQKLISKAKVQINRSQIWAQFEVALLIILIIVIYIFLFKSSGKKQDVFS
ncbi:MCP four helix bundle domain-containing protein [Algoriphagus pacificus]|uniref:MCP four helix bundle domain-containing protein n=1 Tax=Algoriphagus pacificus TaxID=2811234 RepID=A0ABS3CM05_9BACT|nr:MCP four helix bundle domain-containing protein [Algoriphagus pacificus]MBN7818127.1 MCP four helix bundle domain-containing protein [Algoriphagus pacificus]